MTVYAEHKERMVRRRRAESTEGRDIGAIPDIAEPERRDACRFDLALFGRTYVPEALYLPLSRDHVEVIARIQDAALHGALYALGMYRGAGKTTWCRIGCLWALSYRHRRYPFIIGATEPKAVKNLGAIKSFMRFGAEYTQDFPEISFPIQSLAGVSQKANGQLCLGESTLIRWDVDELVLPTVPPPSNWPKEWPLRSDGMVPTSGSCVSVAGLTGEGIRGSLMTLDTGEQIRPDFILLDDPQTRESAKSPSQNATRIELVSGDVLGMAGPGKSISAVMPCTPILPGDMADVMLDRKTHPLWRGDRRPMLVTMPKNLGEWDRYFLVYSKCAQRDPPDYVEANELYLSNRDKLDEGAEAAWAENFLPTEVGAIQAAMHIYFRDPRAFASERQLRPLAVLDDSDGLPKLSTDVIRDRVNNHPQGLLPRWANTLTASVDVHDNLLFWCVTAWGESFAGAVVSYGVWPPQNRLYFTKNDAAPTIRDATKISTIEGAIYAALRACVDPLCAREWKSEAGIALRVSQCFVDCGYRDEVVYRFCRESPHAAVLLASKGLGISADRAPMSEWKPVGGEKRQKGPAPTWTIRVNPGKGRHVFIDVNAWKTFVTERLLIPMGEPSALTLFGPADHRLFADHLTAEYRVRTQGRGRECDVWRALPTRDNHYFDVLVGTACAASLQGIGLMPAAAQRKAVKWSEVYKAKAAQ